MKCWRKSVTLNTSHFFYSVTVFPQAYDDEHFAELVTANDSVPEWINGDVIDRIIDYAERRAQARGEDSALDGGDSDCVIITNWSSFTDDWGFSDGNANQVAFGVFNEELSAGKGADLFTDVEILQSAWLRSGDGRKKQAAKYTDEEYAEQASDFDVSGQKWIPNGAQQYICIIEITSEMIHGEAQLSEAM